MRPELVDRHKFIGASEAAAVLGVSPFQTPVDVYLSKVQPELSPTVSGSPADCGHRLEEAVAQWWADETGNKVRRQRRGYVHANGILRAHLDRLVVGKPEAVEAKTTGVYLADGWGSEGDEIPLHVRIQTLAQMSCAPRLERVHVAVLINASVFEFRRYVIERDQPTCDAIANAAALFMSDHVEARVPPPLTTPADGRALFGESDNGTAAVADRGSPFYAEFVALMRERAAIAAAKKRSDAHVAHLMDAMGTASVLRDDQGETLVTWKTSKDGRRPFKPSPNWKEPE